MGKILPFVLVLIAVGGAGFAAKTLRAPDVEAAKEAKEAELKAIKDKDTKKKNLSYYKFQRNYIVPIMRGYAVDAVVLVDFTVEMDEEKIETIRPREPRIRDAFMKTLLTLSNEGIFDKDITDPKVFETLQKRLLETAKEVMDSDVKAVLIVDFARQDR